MDAKRYPALTKILAEAPTAFDLLPDADKVADLLDTLSDPQLGKQQEVVKLLDQAGMKSAAQKLGAMEPKAYDDMIFRYTLRDEAAPIPNA